MKFITAKELYESNPDPVEWICKPWLAIEAITELDGKAKTAGKTTLTLAMCKAILNGEPFLGEPTTKSPIVYLTEESKTTFRAALERSGIGESKDLHVLFWRETHKLQESEDLGTPWEQIVRGAIREAHRRKARVLVVDTFAQFAKLIGDTENSAGAVLKAMLPLQEARDEKLAVWVIRHERKEGGGLGQSGRGSSAMSGAVDIILRLHKPEGRQAQNVRQLDAVSRFDDTPDELTLGFSECGAGYEVLGETGGAAHEAAIKAIYATLPTDANSALSLGEICQRTTVPRSTIQTALSALESSGFVTNVGAGKRGDPRRYYQDSAETRSPTPPHPAETSLAG